MAIINKKKELYLRSLSVISAIIKKSKKEELI